jgi:hypothetical protein
LDEVGAPGDSTTELIGKLWEAGETDFAMDWEPEDLSRRLRSRRRFRWTVIVVALAVAAGAWFGLQWLPTIAEDRAAGRSAEYQEVLNALSNEVSGFPQAIVVVTDAASGSDTVLLQVGAVARFSDAAEDVNAAAAAPLPQLPPLVPDDAVTALRPARERLGLVGMQAAAIGARMNQAITYRIIADGMFLLPSLPVQVAGTNDVAPLGVALAESLVDTVTLAADLPDDPAFSAHRARTQVLIADLEPRQADYLDALRRDDFERATEFTEWIAAELAAVDAELGPALAEIADWSNTQLAELEQEITDARVLATP